MSGDEAPVMDVPGYGRYPVLRVYAPNEALPCDNDETLRFLVTKDGTSYQVPLDAFAVPEAK